MAAAVLVHSVPSEGGVVPTTQWQPLIGAEGAVDVGGPLDDGRFVLAAGGRLFLLDPAAARKEPLARGKRGYRTSAGEPYFALAEDAGSGCRFRNDDLFALEPRRDPAIVRISAAGRRSRFTSLPDRFRLDGIAYDAVGSFGYRLLVLAVDDKRTSLIAIDCRGGKETISKDGPRVEGGIEVAPQSFGRFAGALIAADEYSGRLFAFAPSGEVIKLANSGLPAGRDVGVEAVGFVPPGFGASGLALLSDQGREEERVAGEGSVLSIDGAELAAAGIAPGDLLVATEGGARTIRVRCEVSCEVTEVAGGPAAAHAEGHIEFAEG
ncbi:MAG: hypothetical protein ACR2OC_12125 [Solirubrobacterales bacterium]